MAYDHKVMLAFHFTQPKVLAAVKAKMATYTHLESFQAKQHLALMTVYNEMVVGTELYTLYLSHDYTQNVKYTDADALVIEGMLNRMTWGEFSFVVKRGLFNWMQNKKSRTKDLTKVQQAIKAALNKAE